MIVSKSKIDSSYPNSQFTIPGYELYRNDRKKGGGGILAYVSSELICKRIKPVKSYKTIEVIVLDIKLYNCARPVQTSKNLYIILPSTVRRRVEFVTGLIYKDNRLSCLVILISIAFDQLVMKENYFLIYKQHMNSTVSFLTQLESRKLEGESVGHL